MLSDIENFTKKVKDNRRKQGVRHPLDAFFKMCLLGVACGYSGYRPLARFMKANRDFFVTVFNLKHGVPGFATIRNITNSIDKQEIVDGFNDWIAIQNQANDGDWIAGDGKALASTKTDVHNSNHDFVSVVSLYAHATGLCVYAQDYQRKKSHENKVLLDMLEHLKNKNITITADALHFQKKL